ncbi:MAG: hypothetical protein IKF35_11270, partial [Solobacterium sp.]|nr:hypothetical protein [Solobacterium sp.]
KTPEELGVAGLELTYEQLLRQVYASGAILMGIRTKENPFRILAENTETITLGETDRLIVISEE